jgi:hypothetical protein
MAELRCSVADRAPHWQCKASVLERALCWLFAWFSATVTLPPSQALAQAAGTQKVALIWRAPADAQCSSGEQIRVRVATLSDQPLTLDDAESRYRIEVAVAPSAQHWQAEVTMLDTHGQTLRARTVAGRTPSCGSIDVAAAVVIATMLDSLSADMAPAPTSPPLSAARQDVRLAAFAAVSSELIPQAWLGGGLGVELGDAIQLAFSASAYAPGEQRDARGRGARAWGFHVGATVCPAAVRSKHLDLHLCAGVQGGAALASGVGLTRAAAATVPLVFALAGPKLTLKLTRTLAVQLAASAAWAFIRPKFVWSVEGEREQAITGSKIALLMQLGITISPW